MIDSDIITARDLEAEGYDVAWAESLPIPTYREAGEPYWRYGDIRPWLDEEGNPS